MASPMNMNSFEGKRIVALVREGDYAHAGEEEAIERAFRSIPIPRLCRRRARRPAPLDFTSGRVLGPARRDRTRQNRRSNCPRPRGLIK